MDEQTERAALLSALTTEHFVLQTANNATYSEASARSILYVTALSSALVAMGFVAGSTDVLIPFAGILLPAIFVLGIFTVVRLVETVLESQHCLNGIARIRNYYRSLGPEAAHYFASEYGRWPEAESPALRLGAAFAFFGTTASMIAVINNLVAGIGMALLTHFLAPTAPAWLEIVVGIAGVLLFTWLFYAYQRWRVDEYGMRVSSRTRAKAAISVGSSQASAYDQTEHPVLSEIRLNETFTGDIEAYSTVQALQIRSSERSANMISLQRVRGKLAGRQGSFVLQGSESIENGRIKATWFVVPCSGTGELAGLRGEGGFEGEFGKSSIGTLDYWFE